MFQLIDCGNILKWLPYFLLAICNKGGSQETDRRMGVNGD